MPSDSPHTAASSVSAPAKTKSSVAASFRVKTTLYNDLLATFIAVNGRNPVTDTELHTAAIQYYTQNARLGNASGVNSPVVADLNSKLENLQSSFENLQTDNTQLEQSNRDLTQRLATHFLIEENDTTRAMAASQLKRKQAGKPHSENLTVFTGFLFTTLRDNVKDAEKELLK